MSISTALGNAISGLGAAGRTAQVVSSNISNALTPGYGRREVQLSSGTLGGVRVEGVARRIDPAILSDRRLSDAELGHDSTRTKGLERLSVAFGTADSPNSLPAYTARLSSQLIEAASQPSSETRLQAVFEAAQDMVSFINRASDTIQGERFAADQAIAKDVEALNSGLARIHKLNREIAKLNVLGKDSNGLKDVRQTEIDKIAEIVPLRELPRQNGAVALMTGNGQTLLDSEPATIGFTPTNAVSPTTTLGAPLSGLTVGGRPVDAGSDGGRLSGGRLQALFEVRDVTGPDAQAKLDGFARDLIERFQDGAVDPSLAPGAPGLFTDGGSAFAAADESGISRRLTISARVDPAQGGELFRLRVGLGNNAPGPQGSAAQLQSFLDAMQTPRGAQSTALGPTSLTLGGQADSLLSLSAGAVFRAEQSQSYSQARSWELIRQELSEGVDTDQEMQTLLLVEQAYGANAKVIQAVDAMLNRLLEI